MKCTYCPELLAALQRLVDAIDPEGFSEDEDDSRGPGCLEEYFEEPVRQARAVIAKANNEEAR